MHQSFTFRVRGETSTLTNKSVLAHVKEKDMLPSSYYKHWEPEADTQPGDRQEKGRWVQHWTLQPTIKLHRFPPTFSSELVDCAVCRVTPWQTVCTLAYPLPPSER